MNKAKSNNLIFIVLLFIVFGCSGTKKAIEIKKRDTDKSIIIKMNSDLKKITGIKFPFILTISNSYSSSKDFMKIKYL